MENQSTTPSAQPFSPIAERSSTLVQVARLRTLLPAWLDAWELACVAETASTNSDLLQLGRVEAMQHLTPVTRVRQADMQTAGRGRLGRQWLSQQSDSLMFSLSLTLPRPLGELSGLSLVCGVAVVDALSQYFQQTHGITVPEQLGLKWPNDVLFEGRKLAGILLETASTQADSTLIVIGIGLNLRRNASLEKQLQRELAGVEEMLPWSGHATTSPLDVTALFAEILKNLALQLDAFSQNGFAHCRNRWMALDAYAGKSVSLLEGGVIKHHGTACGVDDKGLLRLATEAGLVTLIGGELSLRVAPPEGVAT